MINKILLSVLLINSLSVNAQMINNVDSMGKRRSTSFSHSNIGSKEIYMDFHSLSTDKVLKLLERKAKVKFYFDRISIRKKVRYTFTGGVGLLDEYLQCIFHSTDVYWSYYDSMVIFYTDPAQVGPTGRSDRIRILSN